MLSEGFGVRLEAFDVFLIFMDKDMIEALVFRSKLLTIEEMVLIIKPFLSKLVLEFGSLESPNDFGSLLHSHFPIGYH